MPNNIFAFFRNFKWMTEKKIIPDNGLKYNILIVDDIELNTKILKLFLNNELKDNVKIDCCVNGIEAIKKIFSVKYIYDIIFIDNHMPELNGTETVKILRILKYDKLIIGITGDTSTKSIIFHYCGIDYMFSKPFDKIKTNLVLNVLFKYGNKQFNNKRLLMSAGKLSWT